MALILTDGSSTIVTYPYSIGLLRGDNPNVSFPGTMTNAQLAEWNVYPVLDQAQPSINTLTEYLTEGTPTYSGTEWLQTWTVNTYSAEEQATVLAQYQQSAAQTAASLFEETNKYITQSLTEGLELSPDLISYRATLMDPTSISGYPNNITWPTAPANPFVGAGSTKVASIEAENISVTGSFTIGSTPISSNNVVTKDYVDTSVANASYLALSGGALTGELDMSFQKIIGLADPEWPQDAAHKQYVDTSVAVSANDLIQSFEQGLL